MRKATRASQGTSGVVNSAGGKPRRGPKPRFTRDQVLDVALALTQADGLGAVSLKRVADELGITPMGLYRYFDSKHDLLVAMAARMVDPNPTIDPQAPWHEQLRSVMHDIYEGLMDHPGVGHLFATSVLEGIAVDQAKEGLFGILYRAGFSAQESVDVLWVLFDYIVGAVIADDTVAKQTAPEEMTRLGALPADEFPNLAEIAPAYGVGGSRRIFDYGLELLITGLEATRASGGTGGRRRRQSP